MVTKVDASVVGDQVLGRRNLIINGDMRVAQRSTSSTGSGDYVLDRFYQDYNGGTVTYAQSSLSSSDTPYSHGFRKSIKLTNTSTGSDAANNYVRFQQRIEAQNLSNSGWNYTSDTSFVTLSFWAKSSLAGTYTISLKNIESSASEEYAFEFTLTANTWKKVTHAIKGNSEIVFDNDSGEGLRVEWFPHLGTNYTTSSNTLETSGYTGSFMQQNSAGTDGVASNIAAGSPGVSGNSWPLTKATNASAVLNINADLRLVDSDAHVWAYSFISSTDGTTVILGAGQKTLSARLTNLGVYTYSGYTFDAGKISIQYE